MARITAAETFLIDAPLERSFEQLDQATPRATEVLVRLHADTGHTGLGTGAGLHTVRGAADDNPVRGVAELVRDHLGPAVIGGDPRRPEALWQRMFGLTMDRGSPLSLRSGTTYPKSRDRAAVMAAIAAVDIAVWDLYGHVLSEPLWRLLGGTDDRVAAYTTGGYYRPEHDLDALVEEFQGYVEAGFRAVKLKAGGRTPQVDVERARIVRETIGPEVDLYIDAHTGWTVEEAVQAGHGYEALGVCWFEEPAPWYDSVDGLARVASRVRIPITAGESVPTRQDCLALMDHGGISITNFDCTKSGGITEGRKVAVLAEARGIDLAPHHAAHVHAPLTAAVPNGRTVELHRDATRDPLSGRLYLDEPEFVEGHVRLSDRPGLGIRLDEDVLAEVGERLDPR